MLLIEWLKWVLCQPYLAMAVWLDGLFLGAAVMCGLDGGASYAIAPLLVAVLATIFFVYKHNTMINKAPNLRVREVLSVTAQEEDGSYLICGVVRLADTRTDVVYEVKIRGAKRGSSLNHDDFSSVIGQIKTNIVSGGSIKESWDEFCIPRECQTPFGKVFFKEIKSGTPNK